MVANLKLNNLCLYFGFQWLNYGLYFSIHLLNFGLALSILLFFNYSLSFLIRQRARINLSLSLNCLILAKLLFILSFSFINQQWG